MYNFGSASLLDYSSAYENFNFFKGLFEKTTTFSNDFFYKRQFFLIAASA